MLESIRHWFGRNPKPPSSVDDRFLEVERQAQTLRLDLEERERTVAALRSDLERQRRAERSRLEEAAHAAIERVLTEASVPAAQLLTQAHLLEVDGKPVSARDILAVARRLVRVLENEGLTLEERVGERVAFDPSRHEPMGGDLAAAGQPVIVRVPLISYRGKVLHKAGVEKTRG